LVGVYLLVGVHIAHWKLNGKTLAPLELNEVLYTLELGIVTAGFLFMVSVCIATALFGRFFCSWACHILALEDLCAWLLEKVRIRPKPVRSRVLLLVPPAVMFYMFLWPQIGRLAQGKSFPRLHWASDADGWASLATTEFWRNLPEPWIAAVTFVVCGFVIVYVLGSRAFCTYVCPYGAVFNLLDRTSPGRIVARGDCSDCGLCTAVCTSHVRVHEELQEFGTVVNPACLKDLDCVAVCPSGTVRYGFTLPPILRSRFSFRRIRLAYDFSVGEELLMAVVFVGVTLTFRGLYDTVPFFLALALAAIGSFVAVESWRLFARRDVRLNPFQFKRSGGITSSGALFLSTTTAVAIFTGHSALFRFHESRAYTALDSATVAMSSGSAASSEALERARAHFESSQGLALWISPRFESKLAELHEMRGELAAAEARYASVVARAPRELAARISLARVLVAQSRLEDSERVLRTGIEEMAPADRARPAGHHYLVASHEMLGNAAALRGDHSGARAAFDAALAMNPDSAVGHRGLGELLADEGQLEDGRVHLQRSVELEPHAADSRYNLAVVLSALGRHAEAVAQLRIAAELRPSDPDVHSNLGFMLLDLADPTSAEQSLRRALELNPNHAAAHYNIARAQLALGREHEAQAHFRTAGRLDSQFALSAARPKER
jgi:tetratricopeptide (TPR) repeat protein/ferredoxin